MKSVSFVIQLAPTDDHRMQHTEIYLNLILQSFVLNSQSPRSSENSVFTEIGILT